MSNETDKALTELYIVIGQLIAAYDDVMKTFSSIVGDVVTMQSDIAEVEKFVNDQFADAITGRNLWQANARIHKKTAEGLMVQLQILADQGHKIEVEIPIKAVEA